MHSLRPFAQFHKSQTESKARRQRSNHIPKKVMGRIISLIITPCHQHMPASSPKNHKRRHRTVIRILRIAQPSQDKPKRIKALPLEAQQVPAGSGLLARPQWVHYLLLPKINYLLLIWIIHITMTSLVLITEFKALNIEIMPSLLRIRRKNLEMLKLELL